MNINIIHCMSIIYPEFVMSKQRNLRRGSQRVGVIATNDCCVNTRHHIMSLVILLSVIRNGKKRLQKRDFIRYIREKHIFNANQAKVTAAPIESLFPLTSLYIAYLRASEFEFPDLYIHILKKNRNRVVKIHFVIGINPATRIYIEGRGFPRT